MSLTGGLSQRVDGETGHTPKVFHRRRRSIKSEEDSTTSPVSRSAIEKPEEDAEILFEAKQFGRSSTAKKVFQTSFELLLSR
ncbi:hypothetical protein CEXT_481961 [Caerostris extrusa]|uniref:Uncharacterized protein n=1 Tax=Caerostris extrusa TaxID=172846 RepID=A0AAV4UF02_CAEEX|nr:hypothetical protein CEXT_481961 [Caerostris extrusa]